MSDNTRDVEFKDLVMPNDTCKSTKAGWIWYCDEHDTHGNADSADEAEWIADSHTSFYVMAMHNHAAREAEETGEEPYFVDEDEVCAIYIMDVSKLITYNFGEDYEDKTSNVVPDDLDAAIEIRKQLGLTEQGDD